MCSAVAESLHHVVDASLAVALEAVEVVLSLVGAAVDVVGLGSNEQLAAVGGKAVAVEVLEGAFASRGGIKEYFHLLSRLEGVLYDLGVVGAHLCVMFAVARDGEYVGNVLGVEHTAYYVFQFNRLLPVCAHQRAEAK